jgi:hypothetical protein
MTDNDYFNLTKLYKREYNDAVNNKGVVKVYHFHCALFYENIYRLKGGNLYGTKK